MMKKLLSTLMHVSVCLILTACTTSTSQVKTDTPPQVRQAEPKPLEQVITRLTAPPILSIDTGGHMAVIRDVIFTRDGKHLVSASDDKTVRIWNVETGEIERVIRGQIGQGHEGKIFAAALSSDNRLLAVGDGLTNRQPMHRAGEISASSTSAPAKSPACSKVMAT